MKALPKPPLPFSFPFLEKLYKEEVLSYVDIIYSSALHRGPLSEEVTALFAALLAFSSMGHLCIEVSEKGVFPETKLLWMRVNGSVNEAQDALLFDKMIRDGFSKIPASLLQVMDGSDEDANKPFILWKNRLYLQRNWFLETKIMKEMKRLKETSPSTLFSEEIYFQKLKELEENNLLLLSQAKALRTCYPSSVSFLCGGPGTGKTYTAGFLFQLFIASLPKERSLKVAIAAPTGKAVSHLKEKMQAHLQDKVSLTSLTLHGLLGLRRNAPLQKKIFPYDLILIDEASMVDARLMAYLLEFISSGTRVIFLGDPDQLPPVEAGSVFADLIAAHPDLTAFLEKAMRFEKKELVSFASAIQHSRFSEIEELFQKGEEITYLKFASDESDGKNKLLEYADSLFHFSAKEDPKKLLQDSLSFRMLSCLRSGPFGVKTLNEELLQLLFSKMHPGDSWAYPILLTENDHVKGLYNGMNGIVISRFLGKKELSFSPSDRIYFEKDGGEIMEIPPMVCPKYELGFCISVHKSQGSEYDHVLLVVPPGSEIFGREILYTAATRARRKLDIFGAMETLEEGARRSSQRFSSIRERT